MNRKGFTLIELLAVIVLIAIIGIITVPNLLNTVDSSKEASYDILIENKTKHEILVFIRLYLRAHLIGRFPNC